MIDERDEGDPLRGVAWGMIFMAAAYFAWGIADAFLSGRFPLGR